MAASVVHRRLSCQTTIDRLTTTCQGRLPRRYGRHWLATVGERAAIPTRVASARRAGMDGEMGWAGDGLHCDVYNYILVMVMILVVQRPPFTLTTLTRAPSGRSGAHRACLLLLPDAAVLRTLPALLPHHVPLQILPDSPPSTCPPQSPA